MRCQAHDLFQFKRSLIWQLVKGAHFSLLAIYNISERIECSYFRFALKYLLDFFYFTIMSVLSKWMITRERRHILSVVSYNVWIQSNELDNFCNGLYIW